ncbi:MAG: TlpA family protein disulfide reductase [Betaproteobacteria bacterium]|nr:TlpA family protein disulfide reductase [Betaproteobacteria bacterium]MCL2886939.1 TlpA family protein disulfide reductase [Betaproteobacteria bacterium]
MKHWLAALALGFCTQLTLAAEPLSSAPLFAATLANLDDQPTALSRYQGKPLVVNFWARWCGPCKTEIPELIKFRQTHKGKIEVLGIGIEERAESVKDFAKAYEMDYPVFVAKAQGIPLMKALGNSKAGLPYTLFIDRQGKIVQQKMGLLKASDLDAATPALLAE